MAYAQFVKSGLTTLVFSRGPSLPAEISYVPNQLIHYTEAGQSRIATLSPPDILVPLVWERLPEADVTALLAWLMNPLINWSAYPWTYTDVLSVARTVRYDGGPFVRRQVAYGLYAVTLPLRVEPFP